MLEFVAIAVGESSLAVSQAGDLPVVNPHHCMISRHISRRDLETSVVVTHINAAMDLYMWGH